MIEVLLDEDYAVDMLIEELEKWGNVDDDTLELFTRYYSSEIKNGGFNGCEWNPRSIVDNDYINNFSVITKDEFEDYDIESEDDDRICASYCGKYLIREG